MKKTVMIFGASSFLGSNLAQALKDDFRIIGTYHNTPLSIPGVTCVPCDVLKKDYVVKLTGLFKPDVSIYAAGMNSLKECKLKPKHADALNTSGVVNVCSAAERNRAKFVLLSSCFVMAGDDQFYREGEMPMPSTTYGSSLSSSEFYVQRSCLNYLIFRCSSLYGRSYNPDHPNIFETTQTSLVRGEHFSMDDTVVTGFLDVEILAKILKETLKSEVTNRLFQVSSSDNMTRYEFATNIARTFHKDQSLIQRTAVPFPSDSQKKGANYFFKMDNTNIEGFLGTKMPTVAESLLLTAKRFGLSA